jgi:heat shock protein HtpX
MLRTQGLLTYARNTQLKIVVMLLCYIWVCLLIAAAISLTLAIGFAPGTLSIKFDSAWRLFVEEWDRILLGGLLWTFIATAMFRRRVERILEATAVDRATESRLYNIVENLAINVGLPVPQINVVESAATNALISGFSSKHMSFTFTRGALRSLNDRQLSAIVAHQFTLVLSGEARKLSLASTLTGISIFAATWLVKPFYKFSFRTLLIILALPIFPYAMAGAMIISATAAVMGAVLLKLSVSRLRIFVCDAGALELTKDAEALSTAIQTMSIRGLIEGADIALRPLLFVGADTGWLDLHPKAEDRVAAIRSYVPNLPVTATPSGIVAQKQAPSWRDNFAVPTWVTGSACSVPLGMFAAYCVLTSNWSAVDAKSVQAFRDDVQVVMEYGMQHADPSTAETFMLQARLYKWSYGIELNLEALENAQSIKKPPVVVTIGENKTDVLGEMLYRKDQAHLITAALKDESKLAKAFYESAYECVVERENSELSRTLARDWASGFATIAHSETFKKYRRFPLKVEINSLLNKAEEGKSPEDLFNENEPGAQDLMDRLYANGLGKTWSSRSCVFEKTRKSVESWITIADIEAVGLRPEYTDAMKAGGTLTSEDKKIVVAYNENQQALDQMLAVENVFNGNSPTHPVAQAVERLKKAPWNQGYPPLMAMFFSAFFLFLSWKLVRSIRWIFHCSLRAIRG